MSSREYVRLFFQSISISLTRMLSRFIDIDYLVYISCNSLYNIYCTTYMCVYVYIMPITSVRIALKERWQDRRERRGEKMKKRAENGILHFIIVLIELISAFIFSIRVFLFISLSLRKIFQQASRDTCICVRAHICYSIQNLSIR